MLRSVFYLLCGALFVSTSLYAGHEGGDNGHGGMQPAKSLRDIAPLAVSCTEEEADAVNAVACDRNRFVSDCVKITLSEDPIVTWESFDFARHNVVILKEGGAFRGRAVGSDITSDELSNFPSTWTYDFSTGEFLGRPDGEFRNIDEPVVSSENSGAGVYNIWCRYHWLGGMVMKLIVVE